MQRKATRRTTRRTKAKRPEQLELTFPITGRGGRRPRAGRPRSTDSGVSHQARPALAARHPVHVTMRVQAGLPSLRGKRAFRVVRAALAAGREREGFRLAHFSVQTNHLHLLVEARDRPALSNGMNGLAVRIARRLNRLWRRRGKLFADRFHARVLRTPRQVRAALGYVLRNLARHGRRLAGIDRCSSGPWFDGWTEPVVLVDEPPGRRPCVPPRTWLLAVGWRRHGPVPFDLVPGPGH